MPEAEPGDTVPLMPRDEESRLIARAQRGHGEAFRTLVETYKDRLFGFIWRMIRNHHEAEDVCQAAFVKAYESLHSYSDRYAFSTWLYTIAYRLCLNTLRKRRSVGGEIDFSLIGTSDSDGPAAVANSEEARRLRELIWAAVDELSPAQKSAVLLFYREEKSCQEIGEILEMPAVTVKSHLHRARARLREALSKQGLAEWPAVEFRQDSHLA